MKRWLIFVFTFLIVLNQASTWTVVYATSNITTSCGDGQYSVDRITGENAFTNLACYPENQFTQALDRMNTEAATVPNVVVRHNASNSPMNVVAADRAMAYSQNDTYLNSTTINIYDDKALSDPYTYINQSNPLYYYSTHIKTKAADVPVTPSDLSAFVEINGAKGYINLNGIDIVPLIYVENGWLISFFTRTLDTYTENKIRAHVTTFTVLDVTSNTIAGSKTYRELRIRVDTATSYFTRTVGIAPGWLGIGTYYSADGIHFFTDMDLKQPVYNGSEIGRYYPYYSYLNLRSKTNYTDQDLQTYFNYLFTVNAFDPATSVMNQNAAVFINAQNTYGMNALIIYAMAAHESDWGRSSYAVNRFNLFGYAAYDSNPNGATYFDSVEHCVTEQMGINLRYYLDYSNFNSTINNSLFYASNIGNKGAGINTRYASDPWWSVKINEISYRIDRYLGFKDLNNYQIAILEPSVSNVVYGDSNLTSNLYSINNRAMNYPLTIIAQKSNTLYTQTTNPLNAGVPITSSTAGLVIYNWNTNLGYVNTNQVYLANTPITPPTIISDNDTLLTYITDMDWVGTQVYIKGWAALKNTNMELGLVTHKIVAINMDDPSLEYPYDMSIATGNYALNLGNGLDYTNAWFDGTFDVTTLPAGEYRFEVRTSSGSTSGIETLMNTTVSAPRLELLENDTYLYRFSFNNAKAMRYELSKTLGLVVENQTPLLPTRFNSMGYFTNIVISETVDGKDLLDITGLAFMQNVSTGSNDSVSHQLLLIGNDGIQHIYPLETSSGIYDVSNGGFNYSHAWFYGNEIDISDLPDSFYNIYVITSTSLYKDTVEVRDILIKGERPFATSDKTYTFIPNLNVRRRYSLRIDRKPIITTTVSELSVTLNTPYTGQILASDPDGANLIFSITTMPTNGTLELNHLDGTYTYTPATNYIGEDSFVVVVNNGISESNPYSFSVLISTTP